MDFNLRNRTNENMKDVFFLVQSMGDGIQEKLPLIKKLASLEINPESNFKYTDDVLYAMKKSGCIGACFGIESMSETVLKNMNKHLSEKTIETALDLTYKQYE